MTVQIGPYVVGEIPAPLQYQFQDSDGNALDLTGYTAEFQWGERDGGGFVNTEIGTAALVPPETNGTVERVWTGAEFDVPGRYGAYFWVGNGTNRFASELITWQVCAAVETATV